MAISTDNSDVVEERRFSLTNVGEGNNKFWNIKLLQKYSVAFIVDLLMRSEKEGG